MRTYYYSIAVFGYDAGMVEVIKVQLRSDEHEVAAFTCPKLFSIALRHKDFDLIMILLQMPVNDCFTLIENIRKDYPCIPLYLITQNIAIKVGQVLKLYDDCTKNKRLLTTVVQPEIDKKLSAEKCFKNPLTRTEKKVLSYLLEGYCNKEIAHRLSRSKRTIEDHRANIMRKLGAENIVDLIKVAAGGSIGERKPAITMDIPRQKQANPVQTTIDLEIG